MDEGLGQLIFFVVLILFGLLSSARKKKARPRPGPERTQAPRVAVPPPGTLRRRPPDAAAPRSAADEPAEAPVQQVEPAEPRAKRGWAEDLLEMLQDKAQKELEQESVALQPPELDDEARSLEVIESADVERLPRTRELPAEETPEPHPYVKLATGKPKRALTREELRHAFVMKEILSPPKGLDG